MSLINSLRFENVSFGFEKQDLIFGGLSFDFPMNQTVWIHALSGEGRSSLLQLMAVLQQPEHGAYYINDQNVSEISFEEFLPYRLKIGYGFDFGGLLNNRTVLENLTLPLLYHKILPAAEAKERALRYLRHMGIEKHADRRPAVIPGGVRKIACMIRALILHPEVLLLDDPNVGMNEESVLKFFDLLKNIRSQENALQHTFVSSFDTKLMNLLGATEVIIDEGQLYLNQNDYKIVVNT